MSGEKNHVGKELSAYLHGELSPAHSRQVGEHLMQCRSCREEFELIKLGSRFAGELPVVTAPETLWQEVERRLDRISERPRPSRWRFAAAAALILGMASFLVYRYLPAERQAEKVVRLEGVPRLGEQDLQLEGQLGVGEWLTTDEASRARIEIAELGEVDVEPGSRVQLIKSGSRERRLALEQGEIHARIWAPPRLFFVETPAALAVDLGCAYSLRVEPDESGLLSVTSGWVALEKGDRESLVPAGAACRIHPRRGPGIPFFEDAPEDLKDALQRLEEGQDVERNLEAALQSARRKDSLSLWALFFELDTIHHPAVYGRLSDLVPPPADLTRDSISTLDREGLHRWRAKIEELTLGSVVGASKTGKASMAPGTLRILGKMKFPRTGHAATLLADGRVLISGGDRGSGPSSSAELFYPEKALFSQIGNLTEPRFGHTATRLGNGQVLLTGGISGLDRPSQTAEVYDPAPRSFRTIPGMSQERSDHRATPLADGRILITGGIGNSGNRLRVSEIYDPAQERFFPSTPLIHPRSGHTATLLLDGRVLIAGGGSRQAEIFDPSASIVLGAGDTVESRVKHAAVRLDDGRVLLIGGGRVGPGDVFLSNSEVFDPAGGGFRPFHELSQARYKIVNAALLLADGRVLVAGGGSRLEVFDPVEEAFRVVGGSLGGARYYATATRLKNGRVLILGGYGYGDKPTADAWLFQP